MPIPLTQLTRFTQYLFGNTATANQMAQYGSLAAGSPMRYSGSTIDPSIIQALGEYASGWFSAVEGAYSPAIEDMNSLFYLAMYQLAYSLQSGIPEYDASTTYFIGNIVRDIGTGNVYQCLVNGLTGTEPPSAGNWGAIQTNSGFNVGTASQSGLVNSTVTNASVASTSDGTEFSLISGSSTGTGTANLDIIHTQDGAVNINNTDVAGVVNLSLAVGGGAVTAVMQALNSGTVNFPFAVTIGGLPIPAGGFNSINIQVLTSSGTYTPTPGMVYCIIEAVGAGGNGGSVDISTGTVGAAGGGGSGAYARTFATAATIGAGVAVTIGAGGSGTTTLMTGIINAPAGGNAAMISTGDTAGFGGTAGNLPTLGLMKFRGNYGGPGNTANSNGTTLLVNSGFGGSSFFGGAGGSSSTTSGTSTTGYGATAFGSGGGGACTFVSPSSLLPGGSSASGAIIVTEFIST